MQRVLDRVDTVVNLALAAILVAMTVIVTTQVFFRYVLSSPMSWPEEASRVILVWLSFVGAYIAMRQNRHIGFGLLVKKLPRTPKFVVDVLVLIMMLFFLGVVIRHGFVFMQRNMNIVMPYMRISLGVYVYSVFPVSGILMFVQTAVTLLERIRAHRSAGVEANGVTGG